MKKIVFILLLFSFRLTAQPEIPVLKNYANDFTSTLTQSQLNELNYLLKSFDDSTSTQIVFLMIRSLQGYPLEYYTYEVADKNKIGRAGKNNGVLFFVAKEDRKMRIEVGYGLEGALPDALASSILRNEVRPYFRKGDYYSGIKSGIAAIMMAVKGEYTNDKREDDDNVKAPIGYIIMIILFLLLTRGGKRGGLLPWLVIGSMGGGRSGGWGGGGFGGGGFSGGGGSFGGGGASGSW